MLSGFFRAFHDKGYINGEWVTARSGKTFPVTNPATDEVLANVPDMDEGDAEASIQAAHQAFQTWRHTTLKVTVLRCCLKPELRNF